MSLPQPPASDIFAITTVHTVGMEDFLLWCIEIFLADVLRHPLSCVVQTMMFQKLCFLLRVAG